MKTCTLKNLTSLKSFYEQIAFAFEFPPQFARNMDDLWEMLTDVPGSAGAAFTHSGDISIWEKGDITTLR